MKIAAEGRSGAGFLVLVPGGDVDVGRHRAGDRHGSRGSTVAFINPSEIIAGAVLGLAALAPVVLAARTGDEK